MWRVVSTLSAGAAFAAATAPDATAVQSDEVLGRTDAVYASWNLDASCNRGFHVTDFRNENLRAAARGLAPSRLRFGGSGNDYLVYEMSEGGECHGIPTPPAPQQQGCGYFTPGCLNATHWDALYGFAEAAEAEFLFGVSFRLDEADAAGAAYRWNSSNAASLLEYMASRNQTMWGYELGNEINNNAKSSKAPLTPAMQAAAMVELAGLARYFTPSAKFVGPDTGSPNWGTWMPGYINAMAELGGGGLLHAATHHVYNGIQNATFNSPKQLDSGIPDMTRFRNMIKNAGAAGRGVEMWAGEMGPNYGGNDGMCFGAPCGLYASAVWYADELALRAAHGYTHHQRQDFFGATYGLVSGSAVSVLSRDDTLVLHSDYWVNYLWKRLIGQDVLGMASDTPTLRAYAFRGTPPSAYAAAECRNATQAVLINLTPDRAARVALQGTGSVSFAAWSLAPPPAGPLANGARLNDVPLPTTVDVARSEPAFLQHIPVAPVRGSVPDGVVVPPLGVTIVCH